VSDHYFKKIIKDSSADKDKQNHYEEKEENEMNYKNNKHDDDCCHDKKCKHDDDCCHGKKCKYEEEKGIFTEFDVSETSPLSFSPTAGTPGTIASLNILDKVKIDVDDPDDEVLLQGTVEWTPNRLSLTADIILAILLALISIATGGAAGTFTLPLSVQATFRIWKSEDNGHGTLIPIFETTDTSPVAALDLVLPALQFGTTTTSFHFVDQNPSCGVNKYFSTIDVSVFATGTLGGTGTPLIFDLLFPSGVVGFTTETHVLTAAEIEDEDKHKR